MNAFRKSNYFLLGVFFLLFSSCSIAEKYTQITWAATDAPPFFILNGELQGQGICDAVLEALLPALPLYQHNVLNYPQSRLIKMLEKGEHLCYPCMIHQPSPSARAFKSAPTVVYPPHVLIFQKGLKERLISNFGNPLKLEKLVAFEGLVFGHADARNFGISLDSVIARLKDVNRLHIGTREGSTMSLLEMAYKGRFDYTIDYPAIAEHYNLTNNRDLAWLAIEENEDMPVAGAVGCSVNAPEFSSQVLADINRVLPAIVASEQYRESLKLWFGGFGERYTNWYEQMVVNAEE